MPLDDTGFTAYEVSELRALFQQVYEEETEETPDWDEDTFLGAFSEPVIHILRQLSLGQQQLFDALHIDNATDRLLDNRGTEKLLPRDDATHSRATVTFAGTSGTVIASGKLLESTANGSRWQVLDVVTIGGSPTDGIVEAVDPGVVVGPAGTITTIVTPVPGLTSVTNAADATLGRARETNAAYRARQLRSLSYLAGRTAPAMVSAVEALNFVSTAVVVNNTTPADTTVGAFTVPAHGHLLLVEPSTLTASEEQLLADKVFEVWGYGTQQGGAQTANVVFRGKAYPIYWDYATAVPVEVDATLTLADGYDITDVAAEADLAVATYFSTLTIGQPVRLLGLYSALEGVDGIEAASVLIEGLAADYTIAETQVATYDSAASSYPEA